MLARGIRSYHRPTRLEEALDLVAEGATPLAGGTRLLATAREVPNVLDLSALGLSGISLSDGDLVIGAMTSLQEAMHSDLAHVGSAGLLPAACRARSASWMIRSMATLGGEAVHAAEDSELAAALLALNAVFVVSRRDGPVEIPAVRFIRRHAEDRAGGLLTSFFVPGAPHGAALERVAVLPSAPALVAVAVSVSFAGETCARARVAVAGVEGPPARIGEAEACVEGTSGGDREIARAADELAERAAFRDDAHAPADYRRAAARALVRRALARAVAQARSRTAAAPLRPWAIAPARLPSPLPYFTSGRVELTLNGQPRRVEIEARTTLLEMLRANGCYGPKHGCETGECGACSVLLDGRPVVACLTLAARAQGRSVLTVEGLGTPDDLHAVQEAFVETGAIQCGYCTPAMELVTKALLDAVPAPNESDVREALAGCLCRCTGYVKPVEAALRAASPKRV